MQSFLNSKKKFFKLVCGAGNESESDIEKLVALYSVAGCSVFDVSALTSSVNAAKIGLEYAGIYDERFICVSLGIKGDPHISKAHITGKCKGCLACQAICPQGAIRVPEVNFSKCIGCGQCYKYCQFHAIDMIERDVDFDTILPTLTELGVDCIELHATSLDSEDVDKKWSILNSKYDGVLSICLDRSNLSNKAVWGRLRKMLASRQPYTTIIQTDGVPMSGGDDDYKTTLQAVAMAELINQLDMPVYTVLSGGTNSLTAKLAKMCNIEYSGIAVGSYARKIVKEYIQRDDFLSNKVIFNEALDIAKKLVESSII